MIGVWILAFFIFSFFRNFGIEDSPKFDRVSQLNHGLELSTVLISAVLTGVLYTVLEIYFDRPFFQRTSFGKVILLKTFLYVVLMRVVFFFSSLYFAWMGGMALNKETMIWAMTSKTFWVILLYFLIVSAIISFTLQISQKFGPGMLWSFLIGKYHKPIEEERIFLFVDLHSSTTIAEELGHIKFSRLLQDCFFDLTDVVTKHHVDVYQYVGDEAVLSWVAQKGIQDKRCLHAYFDYMSILESRKQYYQENYGLLPYFKAGLHMGKVTAAEVGVVKKEIAYHGDVLNTTSRIQALCNKYGQALLVSEEIVKNLAQDHFFKFDLMASPLLKGKTKKVNIYSVQQNPN